MPHTSLRRAPYVTAILHFAYEIWSDLGKNDELIPPYFRHNWGRYLEHVASFSLPEGETLSAGPRRALHLHAVGRGGFRYAEAILGTCVAGTPEEIAHQLTQMERNGLTAISLLPPAESQRKVFRDFAETVMPLMR